MIWTDKELLEGKRSFGMLSQGRDMARRQYIPEVRVVAFHSGSLGIYQLTLMIASVKWYVQKGASLSMLSFVAAFIIR